MLKSVIDMVDQIGKKEQDITGLTFMDKKKHIIKGTDEENEFNMDDIELVATYPKISEIQEEISDDNAKMDIDEPDQGKDLNDLPEVSAENADEGEINDDVPTNQSKNETGSQDNPNHEPESHGVDVKEETNKYENDKNEVICQDKRNHENETEQQSKDGDDTNQMM